MIVESNQEKYQLDSNRWISTLPKKKKDNTVRKYSLTIFLFVVGLILVSTIKNETRNLQKKINNLNKLILTTSGSTQSPKFVRLSNKNLLSNTKNIIQYLTVLKVNSKSRDKI